MEGLWIVLKFPGRMFDVMKVTEPVLGILLFPFILLGAAFLIGGGLFFITMVGLFGAPLLIVRYPIVGIILTIISYGFLFGFLLPGLTGEAWGEIINNEDIMWIPGAYFMLIHGPIVVSLIDKWLKER
jgi:hypothetical protein